VPLEESFIIGACIDAVGAEGAAEASDWRLWERRGLLPHSSDGAGFGTDYRSDLRLLGEQLGLNAVRLELDWARIEPENDRVDPHEVERAQRVLSAAADAGLAVWATLVERSLPGWFALDELGFRDRRARTYYWPRHVARCADLFGDHVAAWVPLSRPLRWARSGFLTGLTPPGRSDVGRFADALTGAHLAQLEAWRVLRGGAPVVFGTDLAEVRPADGETATRQRARRAEQIQWLWTAAFRDGELKVADYPAAAARGMPEAFDVIGITLEDRAVVPSDGDWSAHHVVEDGATLLERVAEQGPDRPLAVLSQHVANPDELAVALNAVEGLAGTGLALGAWFGSPALDAAALGDTPARPGLVDRDRNLRATGTDLAALQAGRRRADDFSGAVLLEPPPPAA
jgi:beta-glucosidase/6-phospho-beta-glucosidase/beta-galactosidase